MSQRKVWGAYGIEVTVREGELPPYEIHAMPGFPRSMVVTVHQLRRAPDGSFYYESQVRATQEHGEEK